MYDAIEYDDEVDLVFEYCRDGDLLRRVNSQGSNEALAKQAMLQLVPAVHHAHSRGWAHLDIKVRSLICFPRYLLLMPPFNIVGKHSVVW